MDQFRKDIRLPLIKVSVIDPNLLYEAIADIPDYVVNNEDKKYDFDELDKIILRLANNFLFDDRKNQIFLTFIFLYQCKSIEETSRLLANNNKKALPAATVNRYRTKAIEDMKRYIISDLKLQKEILETVKKRYNGKTNK